MSKPVANKIPIPHSPARRVTFSETIFYDDGLVPVRSHQEEDGIELGEIKKSKATEVESMQPAVNKDEDRICGLRKRTIVILSIVAALIIGALLGGIAGGLIASQNRSVANSGSSR
jgi:hypothetical protein